jgi:hypothetical protein
MRQQLDLKLPRRDWRHCHTLSPRDAGRHDWLSLAVPTSPVPSGDQDEEVYDSQS